MSSLAEARQRFAEEIKYRAQVSSPRVLRAFATVPRERFLDNGPWRVRSEIVLSYWTTEDANPVHLYHDVLVAIDESRSLDNGLPSLWARLFDALAIQTGEHVVHVGCGTGYYSAILSEVVGPSGRITAIEFDIEFAQTARENLQERSNVKVIHGDGCSYDAGMAEVIVVNAGVTYPHALWLDSLPVNGRLELPLTTSDRQGTVFIIKRLAKGYAAKALRRIEIFPCEERGSVQGDPRLIFWKQAAEKVNSLRREHHEEEESCWLHGAGYCLSTKKVSDLLQ